MSNSLRDQLIKSGLVSEKQARAKTQGSKKNKQQQKAKQQAQRVELSKQEQEKKQKDLELNRQREQRREEKELRKRLRIFLKAQQQNDKHAQEPFNFQHGKQVKRIYVNDQQRQDLVAGKLIIAEADQHYYLLKSDKLDELKQLSDSALVYFNDESGNQGDDDEYADYQVPDDLIW